jgi:hypothetical protein
MATPLRTVPGTNGDPLAEASELTRRLKLPHLRRVLADLIPSDPGRLAGAGVDASGCQWPCRKWRGAW